ncbi:MAG TPA: choice-of-anchor L domain-containing protein, partial [Symbiobacteriaceae bacterium]|nr:choice-of-anchor L domain-containing protein [Symbiobacteriaceae bacterium]
EFVGSPFNDVFGFFLNGTNVALVPGTGDIVSVNSINGGSNAAYYRSNTGGTIETKMDGLTVVMTISAPVNKNGVNHMKLAIADRGDHIIDSNVFLKQGSFSTTPPPCTMTPSLTFESPLSFTTPANVNAGDTFPIDFRWLTCTGSTFESSVTVRVRDAATGALIAGYTYGYDIAYNPGTGLYSQPFNTALHSIGAGRQLKVMVYIGGKLRGTALVNVN